MTEIAVLATLCVSLLAILPVFPGEAQATSSASSSRRRLFATAVAGSPRRRATHSLSHADELNQSDPLDSSLALPCPALWQDAPLPRPQKRLLVISIGGVGTTALMQALRTSLRAIHYEMNAVPDADLLKHAPYSIMGRARVLRRSPAAILYLIGNPLAALESHFRRGWAGFQVRPCKVTEALFQDARAPRFTLLFVAVLQGCWHAGRHRAAEAQTQPICLIS